MKPTLEPAGNLLVPVDETGTAVRMPEDAEQFTQDQVGDAIASWLAYGEESNRPGGHGGYFSGGGWAARCLRYHLRNRQELEHVLARLVREARMFRDHGHGREHLTNAILDAQRVLDGGAL